jgi:YaiO family outer membrane protein
VKRQRHLITSAIIAIATTAGAATANAQDGAFVEATAELSPVRIATYQSTWRVARVGGGVQKDGRFGWNANVERHQRGSSIDWAGTSSGFDRVGDWTFGASVGYSSAPDFLYRRSVEGELSRRIVGGLVLSGGYRYLEFPALTVSIAEPGASWYFSRGEIAAKGFVVHHEWSHRQSSVLLLRSAIDVSRRVAIGGGVAAGARIFDVDTFGRGSHDAWQAFASMRLRATEHWTMELLAGGAHEDPLFTQQTLATRLRWGF